MAIDQNLFLHRGCKEIARCSDNDGKIPCKKGGDNFDGGGNTFVGGGQYSWGACLVGGG